MELLRDEEGKIWWVLFSGKMWVWILVMCVLLKVAVKLIMLFNFIHPPPLPHPDLPFSLLTSNLTIYMQGSNHTWILGLWWSVPKDATTNQRSVPQAICEQCLLVFCEVWFQLLANGQIKTLLVSIIVTACSVLHDQIEGPRLRHLPVLSCIHVNHSAIWLLLPDSSCQSPRF